MIVKASSVRAAIEKGVDELEVRARTPSEAVEVQRLLERYGFQVEFQDDGGQLSVMGWRRGAGKPAVSPAPEGVFADRSAISFGDKPVIPFEETKPANFGPTDKSAVSFADKSGIPFEEARPASFGPVDWSPAKLNPVGPAKTAKTPASRPVPPANPAPASTSNSSSSSSFSSLPSTLASTPAPDPIPDPANETADLPVPSSFSAFIPEPGNRTADLPAGKRLTYLLTDDALGKGDWGETVMRNFLAALSNSEEPPEAVILVNGGVRLARFDGSACDHLKAMKGTKILVSSACAAHFGLSERVGVGMLCDMVQILDALRGAGKVIAL